VTASEGLRLETIVVVPSTGFFADVSALLIAIQRVAVASTLVVDGSASFKPGNFATLQAKHLRSEVRLPLYGPIEAAVAGKKPSEIQITLVHGRTTTTLAHTTAGFSELVHAIFLPFLVAYHERFISEVKGKFGAERTRWPSAWQMSWALRNAASHNGKVFDDPKRQPVSWRGLEYSPADEVIRPLLSLVNGGDILLLLFEMEELRTGVQLRRA
jgi:hypothetical protein